MAISWKLWFGQQLTLWSVLVSKGFEFGLERSIRLSSLWPTNIWIWIPMEFWCISFWSGRGLICLIRSFGQIFINRIYTRFWMGKLLRLLKVYSVWTQLSQRRITSSKSKGFEMISGNLLRLARRFCPSKIRWKNGRPMRNLIVLLKLSRGWKSWSKNETGLMWFIKLQGFTIWSQWMRITM